jgi:oxygen-independent coproporphyrinogen-3 oxidase
MSLGLYLHIPFCSSICSYCNFNRGLFDAELKTRYVGALAQEIRGAGDGRHADTIFFGGGTPSLLDPSDIRALIDACRSAYDLASGAEITLETNPETAARERLDAFRAAGVTRLSFGVQSFDPGELARLGRIHTADRAAAAVHDAKRAGFDSVSFDLMFWLPGQTKETWMSTIERAIALAPDHLSLYLLELYPNAPLKDAMARATSTTWNQAPDDQAAEMYLAALERLDAAGLAQYEISNAARPGHLSRHNVKYWQGGSWRGFGCGAHSTVDHLRWKNLASTSEYVDRIAAGQPVALDEHRLSGQAQLEEALFTGLRLTQGIDRANFSARFGVDPWIRYGSELSDYVNDGLMWTTEQAFGLTRGGMLVANEILLTFV